MAYNSKKSKQKPLTQEEQEQLDREIKELAELIYDIYQIRSERRNKMRSHNVSDKSLKEFKELCEQKGIKYDTEEEYRQSANNLVNLMGTLVEIDMEERQRKHRLEKEPKGFTLEGKGRNCSYAKDRYMR